MGGEALAVGDKDIVTFSVRLADMDDELSRRRRA
jgi:hypothetical protein